MIELNSIYNEDCMDGMNKVESESVDMILSDLPYGTTPLKWDKIIPIDKLWEQYKRIIKRNGAIVLTASQPFTSLLVASNLEMFRYEWIWVKSQSTNFLNCNRQVGKVHENILIFSKNPCVYYPQKRKGLPYTARGRKTHGLCAVTRSAVRRIDTINSGDRYPVSVIKFKSEHGLHPTQKPVDLYRYLIETYTRPNELVLDSCIGSGTTAVACIRSGRRFIGIEADEKYYKTAKDRIEKEQRQISIFEQANTAI